MMLVGIAKRSIRTPAQKSLFLWSAEDIRAAAETAFFRHRRSHAVLRKPTVTWAIELWQEPRGVGQQGIALCLGGAWSSRALASDPTTHTPDQWN